MSIALLLLLAGQAAPVAATALPDRELAAQRGGFRLPSGIDVALTVQTQTAVDGAVVLRTVFQADHGSPSLMVYAPRSGTTVTTQGQEQGQPVAVTAGVPTVSYDPRNGLQVTPSANIPAITVTSGTVEAADGASPDLQPIDVRTMGADTGAGRVTQTRDGMLNSVELTAADLRITHFAGAAFGSAIANSGNDRAIDTQTSVTIDLSNAGPDVLGSALLRVQDLGSAVSAMRAQ